MKKINKKKFGFTLIEILVVVGVVMVVMISISGVMSGVFNSQNKGEAMDKINQNGSWILNELKKNVLNANSSGENGEDSEDNFYCSETKDKIVIRSVKDGEKTTISCFSDAGGYKIASVSGTEVGTTVFLFQKNNDLILSNCDNFVTCSTLPSLQLSNVKFNFDLEAGIEGLSSETTKNFSIDVTLRN
jgi:type II secretory pathway pseudopilin PulG